MDPDHWRQIRSILEDARELPPAERGDYLKEVCGAYTGLRADIESLIAHGDQGEDLLSRPPIESLLAEGGIDDEGKAGPPTVTTGETRTTRGFRGTGDRIGVYRIKRKLGYGGMGAVFLATRDDDEFKRRVALKLLHPGMVSNDIIRRFRKERQILAGIDHPHVAKLYDGGTTAEGLPYLVMEYIEGSRIDEYCDAHRLSIDERLALFRKVCSAVHFAHQNLVVHRDLKPANILVSVEGEPKLLDFGIAKLLNPELGAATIDMTHAEARLMTPEYASPEQVKGDPITTASDVYALGVLLYGLLTGHRPYRFTSGQLHEIARVICEAEPTRPSSVIDEVDEITGAEGASQITARTVAETREGSPERLRRRLKGDLDNIVLMALRKEPNRRYASVEQLSEDLRRVLEELPVKARKGTFTYRGSKFVARHRASLAAAATVVLALVGLTAFSMRERDRAEAEAAKSKAVVEFLQDALGAASPYQGAGPKVAVVDVLADAVDRLDQSFGDQPQVKASLQDTIGVTYRELSHYDEAEPLLRSALEIRRSTLGEEHSDVAESLHRLAEVLWAKGDYAAAEPLFREALAMRRRLIGGEHLEVAISLNGLGELLWSKGEYEEAEPVFREALATRRKLLGDEHRDVAESLNNLALLLDTAGDSEEAEPLHREALAMRRKLLGDEHPDVASSLNNLALLLTSRGDHEAAEPLFRETLALDRSLFGEEHSNVAMSLNNLAKVLAEMGDFAAAEPLLREALTIRRRLVGNEHPDIALSLHNLAHVVDARGDAEAAVSLCLEALAMRRRLLGDEHQEVGQSLDSLAVLIARQHDWDAAAPLFAQAVQVFEESLGASHWKTAEAKKHYGDCLTELGRFLEAEELLLAARPVLQAELGGQNDRTQKATRHLVDLYDAWGKPGKAAEYRAMLKEVRPEAPLERPDASEG